jgi:hypothetical protein
MRPSSQAYFYFLLLAGGPGVPIQSPKYEQGTVRPFVHVLICLVPILLWPAPRPRSNTAEELFTLSLNAEMLRPLLTEIVRQVVQEREQVKATIPDRLAYSEREAAALLGLLPHQLRDERRLGRVRAFVVAGRRVRYAREDLIAYLTRRQWTEETTRRWPDGRPGEPVGNGKTLDRAPS